MRNRLCVVNDNGAPKAVPCSDAGEFTVSLASDYPENSTMPNPSKRSIHD